MDFSISRASVRCGSGVQDAVAASSSGRSERTLEESPYFRGGDAMRRHGDKLSRFSRRTSRRSWRSRCIMCILSGALSTSCSSSPFSASSRFSCVTFICSNERSAAARSVQQHFFHPCRPFPGPSAATATAVSAKVFMSFAMWSAASMRRRPREAAMPQLA